MKKNSEVLLSTIKSATDIVEEFDKIFADKKVSFMEAFGLVGQIANLQNLITNGKAAIQEYWNATNSDREEALNYLAVELELHNHEIDAKLDATFMYLSQLETALRNSISSVRGIMSTWA